MKQSLIACAVASALGAFATSDARAAAFALHEQGISGLGSAYAGAAAVAEDASTVWWNPAGMSRLGRGKHFAFGAAAIVPSTKFTNRSSVAATARPLGSSSGDAGDSAIVPSAFFVMDLNPNWHFGVGVNVPFGLSTSYSPDWLGRFQGIDSEVKTLNVNPSISYKISDAASIGAGVSYQHGEIDLLTAVNFGSAAAEGQSRVGIKGDAWGFNVGGLFNVGPATRVGIHYRSSLSYDMDGNIRFTGIPAAVQAGVPTLTDSNVKMSFSTPDSFAFSVAHRVNDRWELLGDAMYWRWSKIKQIQLIRQGAASSGATQDTLTFNFDDSWRLSAGAHYKLNPSWTLKFGAAYDQSPVPNAESRTVRLPDNDRIWLTVGAKYQMSRAGALDIGYAYIKVRNADINHTAVTTVPTRGTVNGTYKADVHVIGVQYQHTF